MRITNNMLTNQLIYNVSNNLEKMNEREHQLSSGKKIQNPSDDPVAASKILKYKVDLSEIEQYGRNNSDALSWLEATESAITNINSVLQRARELAVQAANGTTTPDDREKIKAEYVQLKEDIVANANFSFAGRYVFSSYRTDQKVLNEDGSFNMDITDFETMNKPAMKYQIGIGENIQVATNGLDILGAVKQKDALMRTFPGAANVIDGSASMKEVAYFDIASDFAGKDYTGLQIEFDGNVYAVGALDGTSSPIEKAQLVSGIKGAAGAGGILEDVADISVSTTGQLVIRAKEYGDIENAVITGQGYEAFSPASDSIRGAGTAATRSMVSYSLPSDFSQKDFTGSTIEIGGTTFTIGALDAPSKQALIGGILSAGGSGTPPSLLSSVADAYMDEAGRLVIKAKEYGAGVSIDGQTFEDTLLPSPRAGDIAYSPGKDTDEAVLPKPPATATALTPADFDPIAPSTASPFDSKKYVVTLNGKTETITLGTNIGGVSALQDALQIALDEKFPPVGVVKSIEVIESGGEFSFVTGNTPDGVQPSLEIRAVTSTKPELVADMEQLIADLTGSDQSKIGDFITKVDSHMGRIMNAWADIGARANRLELVANRIGENNITFSSLLSNAQDVDMAETIMNLKNAENVYKASLSAGARIIQPTLVDFLR